MPTAAMETLSLTKKGLSIRNLYYIIRPSTLGVHPGETKFTQLYVWPTQCRACPRVFHVNNPNRNLSVGSRPFCSLLTPVLFTTPAFFQFGHSQRHNSTSAVVGRVTTLDVTGNSHHNRQWWLWLEMRRCTNTTAGPLCHIIQYTCLNDSLPQSLNCQLLVSKTLTALKKILSLMGTSTATMNDIFYRSFTAFSTVTRNSWLGYQTGNSVWWSGQPTKDGSGMTFPTGPWWCHDAGQLVRITSRYF